MKVKRKKTDSAKKKKLQELDGVESKSRNKMNEIKGGSSSDNDSTHTFSKRNGT